MCAESDLPDDQESDGDCRDCQELHLAEAVANAQRDHSRATDCRVLLRRHQEAADCHGRGLE